MIHDGQWRLNLPRIPEFCERSTKNHEDSGSLIMLAHSAITQMHNRYAVGASTWLIILPKHLCMHVVQCVWGPNKSTLPWKGLYQVEVVLSENWLGKGGL